MTKELQITKTYDIAKPQEVMTMAVVLKDYVVKQKLYTNIKGYNYVLADGWQFAGFLTGMNAIVEEPKNLSNDKEIKYSATAKIYLNDKVVGIGYAVCSNKENIKKSFDEYAILSMAQTRAIGKAYRNKIGWVMKLAGYESIPAEEVATNGVKTETVEDKNLDTKPTIAKLKKATTKIELQKIWQSLSQRERNHPDILDYKDSLKEQL
jgi:hypothetical protein